MRLNQDVKFIRTALSWDSEGKPDCDLDLTAFLLNESGKVRGDDDFVFYNTDAVMSEHALVYGGDSQQGSVGDGLDETILAVIDKLDRDVARVVFCVTVACLQEEARRFSSANHAFFTANVVADPYDKDGKEVCRVDLSGDFGEADGVVVFELIRGQDGWEYDTSVHGVTGGLVALCETYGVDVAHS